MIFNADGSLAIVCNSGSDTVSLIDTTTLTVVNTIAVGNGPFFLVFNEDQTKLYVSNAGENHEIGTLTIIDTATYSVIGSVTLERQPFDLVFVNPF